MKPVAKLFVTRYKYYEYAVHNASGLMIGGRITFVCPVTIEEATQRAIEESANTSINMEVAFDPFNVRVVVKPHRKPINENNQSI